MPDRREVVAEQLVELRQSLRDLWLALTVDPKKQARKERLWTMMAGALGAAATMASRRLATKIWGVLTGEEPPIAQATRDGQAERPTEGR